MPSTTSPITNPSRARTSHKLASPWAGTGRSGWRSDPNFRLTRRLSTTLQETAISPGAGRGFSFISPRLTRGFPLQASKDLKRSMDIAGKDVAYHVYPNTTHWFFESDRSDAFDKKAASLAWTRTLRFLKDA
ncbi:MAG: dienelactone hydrolase family protein [Rhodocyclaceae bacterium]|nr:dienelactone hydrolase family protein [Rhodocyclaceae bacterium]